MGHGKWHQHFEWLQHFSSAATPFLFLKLIRWVNGDIAQERDSVTESDDYLMRKYRATYDKKQPHSNSGPETFAFNLIFP